MGNPVTHFEVLGQDAAALQEFFGQAFGWEMQNVMDVPSGPTIALFGDPEGHVIGLVKGQ